MRISLVDAAGSNLGGLPYFCVDNRIDIYLLRAGYKYNAAYKNMNVSVLPYTGYSFSKVDGYVKIDPPGPAPLTKTDIYQKKDYFPVGLNLSFNPFRFLDFQFKLSKYFARHESSIKTFDFIASVFFSRYSGITYRYKSLKLEGRDVENDIKYSMVGITVLFSGIWQR